MGKTRTTQGNGKKKSQEQSSDDLSPGLYRGTPACLCLCLHCTLALLQLWLRKHILMFFWEKKKKKYIYIYIYTHTHIYSNYTVDKTRSLRIHKFLHVLEGIFYQGEASGFYYWNFIRHGKPLRSHTDTAVRSSYRQPGLHSCRVTGALLAAIFSRKTSQPLLCCSGTVLRSHPHEVEANISS